MRDIRLIVWTFDPLEMRNAHFNFNRLGAIAREYHPNLYGVTTSPLHRGLPTDRLVAEWRLDSARVIAAIEDIAAPLKDAPASIEIPAELERWQREDSPEVARVQSRIREEFLNWFSKNYAAIAVRKSERGSAYLLAPWSDF
jgi:predicted GNAT superfamily acetyltransferase